MRVLRSLSAMAVLLASLLIAFGANADNHENWGPEIGSAMPDGLQILTHEGKSVDLHDLVGKNGLALAFVRSADWCPFCKKQMIQLNERQADFAERGIALAVLSYDSVDILKEFAQKRKIAYTLLSDQNSEVIDAFGIRNEKHDADSMGYGIPHPGIMLFDNQCDLVAKFAEEGYRKRPDIDAVLAAAGKL